MTIAVQEQGLPIKKAYKGVNPEKCLKCGYFFRYFEWSPAAKNKKGIIIYFGVCLCAKTGNGTGTACQAT